MECLEILAKETEVLFFAEFKCGFIFFFNVTTPSKASAANLLLHIVIPNPNSLLLCIDCLGVKYSLPFFPNMYVLICKFYTLNQSSGNHCLTQQHASVSSLECLANIHSFVSLILRWLELDVKHGCFTVCHCQSQHSVQ